jgi:hypothetical protein
MSAWQKDAGETTVILDWFRGWDKNGVASYSCSGGRVGVGGRDRASHRFWKQNGSSAMHI